MSEKSIEHIVTASIEATLKTAGLLPEEEYIVTFWTDWAYPMEDFDIPFKTLSVYTLKEEMYSWRMD